VYRGSALPVLAGNYFYADYCQGSVHSIKYPRQHDPGRLDSCSRPRQHQLVWGRMRGENVHSPAHWTGLANSSRTLGNQ